eukprot:gnl/TRDRNA2_/TRDRNA2_162340_c0_seq1.p1 gnl/TRDRNA2_/TRDRNA2_162340_c0~~gnl/TRDRNA2_/TRDRNA2_162340_c0_seq1.p1  ORF type:complete len:267 (-),score=60.34 gnl/TRDRNA2_/TRDRNA2_162340_c0_seq1:215-1015(-)
MQFRSFLSHSEFAPVLMPASLVSCQGGTVRVDLFVVDRRKMIASGFTGKKIEQEPSLLIGIRRMQGIEDEQLPPPPAQAVQHPLLTTELLVVGPEQVEIDADTPDSLAEATRLLNEAREERDLAERSLSELKQERSKLGQALERVESEKLRVDANAQQVKKERAHVEEMLSLVLEQKLNASNEMEMAKKERQEVQLLAKEVHQKHIKEMSIDVLGDGPVNLANGASTKLCGIQCGPRPLEVPEPSFLSRQAPPCNGSCFIRKQDMA